jgi:hypothetical protein
MVAYHLPSDAWVSVVLCMIPSLMVLKTQAIPIKDILSTPLQSCKDNYIIENFYLIYKRMID